MSKTARQGIILILCALLVFSAAAGMAEAGAPAETAKVTNLRRAIEEGGDKVLWELAGTCSPSGVYQEEGCARLYIWSPDSPAFPVQNASDYPMMHFYTAVMQETAGVGFTLEQVFLYSVGSDGTWTEAPFPLRDGSARIEPCGTFAFSVSGAANENSRYEIITAAGTDDNGHELEFYGVVERLNVLPDESGAIVRDNPDYDMDNLRHEADFAIQVADGVWWVPVRSLGASRYTNQEIAGMAEHSPEQKQEEISTLYEAVQLFQISGFTYTEDNVDIPEDGINWEHHKPGYDAVRTNTGCCAASADWLNYILSGDYEMGFIGWSWPDGNGHVFNYIFQDGWYYFIDLTHYEGGLVTPESGSMAAYRHNERPLGSLHKAKDPETYVKYYLGMAADPPATFRLYQEENVVPSAAAEVDGQMTVYYPEGYEFRIIDGKDPEKLAIQTVKGPEKSYRWSGMKSAKIRPKKKYLRAAEETAGSLTAYRPGDRLTLEDNSAKGLAVIDGIRYSTSKRDEVRLGFVRNLLLYGEGKNGVFDLRFQPGIHGETLKGMDSLEIGDLTLDVLRTVPEVQVIFCVREGDCLTVQEVMDGKHYDSRHVSIRKDENGSWADTPDYWYLIITKDRKARYEFGRFSCAVSDET